MDSCFIDLSVEFLAVSFHTILYYASVYPKSIFETRKKYGVVVYRCIHPEVNQYIDLCLKSAAECLRNGQLYRIEFSLTDNVYEPLLRFVFDLERNWNFNDSADAYLVQTEQNLRAFCLKLSSMSYKFKSLPEDTSFTIHLHTNESVFVGVASNPDFEEFPLVEEKRIEMGTILPIRRFSIRSFNLDSYVEFK